MSQPAEVCELCGRREAQRSLTKDETLRLNADLDARVARRTAELEAKIRMLQDSEERLRLAVEVSLEGFWDWNAKTGGDYFSPLLAERLDCDTAGANQPPMQRWQRLPHPDERENVVAAVERQLREAGRFETEFRCRAKDGAYRWVLCRGKAVERDADGSPLRVIGTLIGIDERKMAEALNCKLAAIVEASSDLIATSTLDGQVDYINQAGRALFGIGPAESLEQCRIANNHSPEALRRIAEEGIPTALAEGRWLGDNSIRRLDDGSDIPVSQLILASKNPQTGRVEFLTTMCRDISERKRAEDALRRLQQEQALILDTAPAMIWYKDTHNRMLRVNAAVAKSLGLRKDQIEGRHTAEFYPEEAERYYQDDLAVARSGQPRLGIEEPYRLPSGEKRWVLTDKVPLLDEAGQVSRILVMAVDITERKKVEEALREADRQKDEFLAILAHELRNPLAPISNGLHIMRLAGRGKPEVMDRALTMMEGQVRDMIRLIDDLLDLSRISRGKIELHKEAINLADVARHAAETCQPLMEQSGHTLQLDISPETIMLQADSTRLAQAFANLLNNAAKFTPPGGRIRFSVESQGQEAVARVCDNGIGIPEAMLDKIFDMFTQTDRSLDKRYGGLGIGLSLVKRLVELHGGTVQAFSAGPDKGSEFIVRLAKLKAADPADLGAPQPQATLDQTAYKVLVVDDNPDVAESNAWLLEIMGHEVLTAHDGPEAIKLGAEFKPDLILLDIGMPGMSGYEACRLIREQSWGRRAVIVALTGWGQIEDKQKSQEAGFDKHLVKPLDTRELEGVLKALP